MKRLLAGVALAGSVALGTTQVAAAYPPDDAEIVVSTTVVTPGGTVTVTLTGCLLGETVRFTLANVTVDVTCTAGGGGDARLMAVPDAAEGSATASLQAPTTPGTYTLTATGLTSGVTENITITVAAADDAAPAGALPATGSGTDTTLWIASGTLTAGLALTGVALFRRRRPTATA